MVQGVGFKGSGIPTAALRDHLRAVADDDLDFAAAVDVLAPSSPTLGDLHQHMACARNAAAVTCEREARHMPAYVAGTFCGTVLGLTGIGYALTTSGAWCAGGVVGGLAGVTLAVAGGMRIHRHMGPLQNALSRASSNVSTLERYGERLRDAGVAELPPPVPAPVVMTLEEKKSLLARLEADIRQAEQRRDGKVEHRGDVVEIAGVKVRVRA